MCGSMTYIQSATAEIRRGKNRKLEEKEETTGQKTMAYPIPYGGHKNKIEFLSEHTVHIT